MRKRPLVLRGAVGAALRILARPSLWKPSFRAVRSIRRHFFTLQRKAAAGAIRVPVVNVEHPLDEKIPFAPEYISIYMDFSACWIRAQGFLLRRFGRAAVPHVRAFLDGLARLYAEAARVYAKTMSTTRRPPCEKSALFRLVHLFDPHLMCVPSLHVMVIAFTRARFAASLRALGGADRFADEAAALDGRVTAIADSVLFVKQHSVNCVAAGLYAVHRFAPDLFGAADAARFADALFRGAGDDTPAAARAAIPESAKAEIRAFIAGLFDAFARAGETAPSWERPLLDFLAAAPSVMR